MANITPEQVNGFVEGGNVWSLFYHEKAFPMKYQRVMYVIKFEKLELRPVFELLRIISGTIDSVTTQAGFQYEHNYEFVRSEDSIRMKVDDIQFTLNKVNNGWEYNGRIFPGSWTVYTLFYVIVNSK